MKDNFDDIVKRKWDAKQFPIDEGHRADMIRLLDQQRKRRGVFFWWMGGLLVVTMSISMFLLSSEINSDQTSSLKNTSASKGHDINQAYEKESVGYSGIEENQAEIKEEMETNPSSYSRTEANTSSVLHSDNKEIKTDDNSGKQHGGPNAESRSTPSNQGDKPRYTSKSKKPEMAMIDPEKGEDEEQQPLPMESTSIDNELDDERSFSIPIDEEEAREAFMVVAIEVLPVDNMELPERLMAPGIKPDHTRHHPLILYADAGIGYIPPSFPDIKSGWSLELGSGVSYGLLKTTNIFLSCGYFLQKGGFNFQRTSTTNQPGFGTRSASNTLTPEKLHLVYSKIGLEQKFRRHSLTGALALQWLYGAQGVIDIRTQDQFTLAPVEENTYGWLVLDGMQRFLWAGEFDYGYQLSPKWKLSLGIKHYFSKLANDDTSLPDQGYYWWGRLAPLNPSFTIQYRIYGK